MLRRWGRRKERDGGGGGVEGERENNGVTRWITVQSMKLSKLSKH